MRLFGTYVLKVAYAVRMTMTTTTATMAVMALMVTLLMMGVGHGADVDGGDAGYDEDTADEHEQHYKYVLLRCCYYEYLKI